MISRTWTLVRIRWLAHTREMAEPPQWHSDLTMPARHTKHGPTKHHFCSISFQCTYCHCIPSLQDAQTVHTALSSIWHAAQPFIHQHSAHKRTPVGQQASKRGCQGPKGSTHADALYMLLQVLQHLWAALGPSRTCGFCNTSPR